MEHEIKEIRVAISEFLWHCRFEKNLNEKTINAYATDLKQFSDYIGETYNLFEVTKVGLKNYLQHISRFQHKTIKRKLASLRAMLNYFECEYDTYINPMRKMQIKIKDSIRLPTVMTIEEVRKILTYLYAKSSSACHQNTYSYQADIRNIAVVELLFASGIRVSELCSLCNKDIDMLHGVIRIIGKGNKERIINICQPETLSALKHWIKLKGNNVDLNAPFFTNRLYHGLSTQSVRQIIHRIISAAGIEKHITPHTFRHTFATLLLEEDVDIRYIQSLLGHSSIAITQIYTHVNTRKQREILQKKHPRRLI